MTDIYLRSMLHRLWLNRVNLVGPKVVTVVGLKREQSHSPCNMTALIKEKQKCSFSLGFLLKISLQSLIRNGLTLLVQPQENCPSCLPHECIWILVHACLYTCWRTGAFNNATFAAHVGAPVLRRALNATTSPAGLCEFAAELLRVLPELL